MDGCCCAASRFCVQGIRLPFWTGVGVFSPGERWRSTRNWAELGHTGVYILVGYKEGDEEFATLCIGKGDAERDRIESHAQTEEFWEHGYVFMTSNNGLNKAHVRWLERELIQQAKKAGRSKLDNGTPPSEPPFSEAERADFRAHLKRGSHGAEHGGLLPAIARQQQAARPGRPARSGHD